MTSNLSFDDAQAILAKEEIAELARFLVTEDGLTQQDFASVVAGIEERLAFVVSHRRQQSSTTTPLVLEWRLHTAEEASAFLTGHNRPATRATVVRWVQKGRLEAGWGDAGGRRPQWLISPRSLKRCVDVAVPPQGTYSNPESPMDHGFDYLERLRGPEPAGPSA